MPHFTVIIKIPQGQPIEGIVSAATIDDALITARKMGHDVDEEATRQRAAADTNSPGKSAALVSILLTLAGGWYFIEVGLAAIILAVLAIEFSQGRRGYPALTAAIMLMIAGFAFRLLFTNLRAIQV